MVSNEEARVGGFALGGEGVTIKVQSPAGSRSVRVRFSLPSDWPS